MTPHKKQTSRARAAFYGGILSRGSRGSGGNRVRCFDCRRSLCLERKTGGCESDFTGGSRGSEGLERGSADRGRVRLTMVVRKEQDNLTDGLESVRSGRPGNCCMYAEAGDRRSDYGRSNTDLF